MACPNWKGRTAISCCTISRPLIRRGRRRPAAGKIRFSIADVARLAPARLWPVRQCLPEQMIFWRWREDRVALPAVAAGKFGLGKQRTDFGLVAGSQERQSIKRASQGALLDEFRATLAEPTGQLQTRIIVGAHKAE